MYPPILLALISTTLTLALVTPTLKTNNTTLETNHAQNDEFKTLSQDFLEAAANALAGETEIGTTDEDGNTVTTRNGTENTTTDMEIYTPEKVNEEKQKALEMVNKLYEQFRRGTSFVLKIVDPQEKYLVQEGKGDTKFMDQFLITSLSGANSGMGLNRHIERKLISSRMDIGVIGTGLGLIDDLYTLVQLVLFILSAVQFLINLPQALTSAWYARRIAKYTRDITSSIKPVYSIYRDISAFANRVGNNPNSELTEAEKQTFLRLRYAVFMAPPQAESCKVLPPSCHTWIQQSSDGRSEPKIVKQCLKALTPTITDLARQGKVFDRLDKKDLTEANSLINNCTSPNAAVLKEQKKSVLQELTYLAYPGSHPKFVVPMYENVNKYSRYRELAEYYNYEFPYLNIKIQKVANREPAHQTCYHVKEIDPESFILARWAHRCGRAVANWWKGGPERRAELKKLKELEERFANEVARTKLLSKEGKHALEHVEKSSTEKILSF